MHIGILIPCTSHKRAWKDIKESYFVEKTLKTFLLTYCREHNYTFYIGYDSNDNIFSDKKQHEQLFRYKNVFKNIDFKFIDFLNIEKGYLTKMWNTLFDKSYNDGCEYFYQCGDDISFKTQKWVNDSIQILKKNNDIGITGPINNNYAIMTQVFVSRKHMEIFGCFFPESIFNWCCDDWYNLVYKPNHFFPLKKHFCSNDGGHPRYIINNDLDFKTNTLYKITELRKTVAILAEENKKLILRYKTQNNL
tara:strand:+ start:6331 stop:7077 length:747 start_codon:yes stop_codon:yes gene_type:complete